MIDTPPLNTAAFVMPHFGDTALSREYLMAAIDSVLAQNDPDWHLFVVDDCSPRSEDRLALERVVSDRITFLSNPRRLGPGPSRNLGIQHAVKRQAPFVLFLDSDDLASSDRLSLTRKVFSERADVGVVYSLFETIDKSGRALNPSLLSPSIEVILRSIAQTPPHGPSAWIEMATTFGYCNLTSTTAVRTGIAAAVPFPSELVSDDMHTWLRYGGYGASFYCIPSITCRYRIPEPKQGSSCRRRYGSGFYQEKARVDSHGFEQALEMAVSGSRLAPGDAYALRQAFRKRLALELRAEGSNALADRLLRLNPDHVAPDDIFHQP